MPDHCKWTMFRFESFWCSQCCIYLSEFFLTLASWLASGMTPLFWLFGFVDFDLLMLDWIYLKLFSFTIYWVIYSLFLFLYSYCITFAKSLEIKTFGLLLMLYLLFYVMSLNLNITCLYGVSVYFLKLVKMQTYLKRWFFWYSTFLLLLFAYYYFLLNGGY